MTSKQRLLVSQLSVTLATIYTGFIPGFALGQDALEEVVVTARKREETLQETPVAVSAFTGETLDELGLRTISDLTRVVPNVDMYAGNGTSGSGNVFIRGIGARNAGVNFDSGVGIYVDGVYVSRADGAVLDNVDLQSVQVLRGPQGTLFGKNTTGGAILYTTNKPVEEFGGHALVRVGNYNQLDSQGTINVPIMGEVLMSRFSLYKTEQDGYVHSEIPDGLPPQAPGNAPFIEDEFNDTNRWGGQAQLRWQAADDLLLDLNYNYGKTDQAARGQNCEVVTDIPGIGWQADLQDGPIVIPSTGQSIEDWCQANQDLGIDTIMANMQPNRYRAEVNTLALTADWAINDAMNFKSITAGRNTEGGDSNELDASGIALLGASSYQGNGTQERNTDALSQELQLLGNAFDEKLDYVVGAFGFREETDKGATASQALFFNALNSPNTAFYLSNLTALQTKNTSASLFSQADWHFYDYWTATLGARYTWEERRLTRTIRALDLDTLATTGDATWLFSTFFGFPGGPGTFNPNHQYRTPLIDPATGLATFNTGIGVPDPLGRQTMHTDESKVTPMASIQRTFDSMGFMDFGNAYFTIANGFLSGGISDTVDLATGRVYEFDPEEVWNYELGFKMDAWEQKLRLNTAVFYTDYEDRQLTTVRIAPTGNISGALINAESSYISGIEFEAIVLPVDNLQLTANVTFNDSDIKTYDDFQISAASPGPVPEGCQRISVSGAGTVDNCPVDRSNENMPRIPDSVFYLAAQYTFETQYGSITPLLSWSYRTNLDNCFDVSSCESGIYKVDQEDITARLTWASPDTAWRVTAFGRNLNDERYVIGGIPLVDVTATAGTVYNQPRTYGIEAAYTW
jgi:iron complex outermembrane recepter protein